MGKETLKLIIGWNCNLDCHYCCNNNPALRETFKPMTQDELRKTNYRDYQLTGGEVLFPEYFSILIELCRNWLPKEANKYVYTNGLMLTKWHADVMKRYGVTGINVGFHRIPLNYPLLHQIHRDVLPIRLWVMDKEQDLVGNTDLPLRVWTLGECDEIRTDRAYLKVKR